LQAGLCVFTFIHLQPCLGESSPVTRLEKLYPGTKLYTTTCQQDAPAFLSGLSSSVLRNKIIERSTSLAWAFCVTHQQHAVDHPHGYSSQAKRGKLERLYGLLPESHGQNLALTVLHVHIYVPYSARPRSTCTVTRCAGPGTGTTTPRLCQYPT
jgi:hypothetical protein